MSSRWFRKVVGLRRFGWSELVIGYWLLVIGLLGYWYFKNIKFKLGMLAFSTSDEVAHW